MNKQREIKLLEIKLQSYIFTMNIESLDITRIFRGGWFWMNGLDEYFSIQP